jgi:hypothetical protein
MFSVCSICTLGANKIYRPVFEIATSEETPKMYHYKSDTLKG